METHCDFSLHSAAADVDTGGIVKRVKHLQMVFTPSEIRCYRKIGPVMFAC